VWPSYFTRGAEIADWVLPQIGQTPPAPPVPPSPPPTSPSPPAPPKPVVVKPHNLSHPYVTGNARPGGLVTCHVGRWANHPTRYQFAWGWNSHVARGVHTQSARVGTLPAGRILIRCAVGASNSAGLTVVVSSAISYHHR
jgi:hypothetical protein